MNELNAVKAITKLRITKILFDAFAIVWFRRADFMRALWVPFLLMLALGGIWNFSETSLSSGFKWVYAAAYYFLFVLFVVNCHRTVLLNSQDTKEWTVPKWSWRETKFSGWSAFIWVIAAASGMAVSMIALTMIAISMPSFFSPENLKPSVSTFISQYSVKLIYFYIFARLCLMFPSVAVDKTLSLRQAIELSRGNGWRLAIIVSMIPLAIKIITDVVYRDDASAWATMLWLTITSVVLTVEVAALSLSYRTLVEHADAD